MSGFSPDSRVMQKLSCEMTSKVAGRSGALVNALPTLIEPDA